MFIAPYIIRPSSCKGENCNAKIGFMEQMSSPFTRVVSTQIIRIMDTYMQSYNDLELDMPHYLDIELRHDLVDSVINGQEIVITGILKMRPLLQGESANNSCNQQIYMKACSIVEAKKVWHVFTERDVDSFTMINDEAYPFKLLVQSIAPEVHGHELVKAGVLLSLFGGGGSQLQDESEINVLLVGDPGIGKSSMLQMCSKISEKGKEFINYFIYYIYLLFFIAGALVSGKSGSNASSQLGIAIQSRSSAIESGGIVQASLGHCTIDDFDRLISQQDSLLQSMQSQVLTLTFSSIYANIKTHTSILATANSMRGHYDKTKLLTENIRINHTLLKEFQLVFVMLDRPNKDLDTSLTDHIKSIQSGAKKNSAIAAKFAIKPKTNNSMNASDFCDAEEDDAAQEFIADDPNYDLAKRLRMTPLEEAEVDLLPALCLKKFIGIT